MTDFLYYNANPSKKIEKDCVTRAIAVATKIPYKAVGELLKSTAEKNGCDELCVCCYHTLLEDTLGYEVKFPQNSKTVIEIAKQYRENVLIVRIKGHLTSCFYGTCVDIWDCTQEEVDCFWIVQ